MHKCGQPSHAPQAQGAVSAAFFFAPCQAYVDDRQDGRQTALMFTFGMTYGTGAGGFDPLILLLIALAIEMYIGDAAFVFKRIPHPVAIIGKVIGFLDAKLNRDHRPPKDRAVRGAISVALIIGMCGWVGYGVSFVSAHYNYGWTLELALTVTLISQRGLYDAVNRVRHALNTPDLQAGRDAVAHIVGRDVRQLDSHGVCRAAIESLAENFSDAVVAPVFWYVLFGFPGLLIYKAVNTLDSMIGHMNRRYGAFGMTAARLDDVLNLIPARLSALFIIMAAMFTPTAKPFGAFRTMWRDAAKHRSPNAGWPESAMAGALNIALGGPRTYGGESLNEPWLGDGSAKIGTREMQRALFLFLAACLINGLWVGGIALFRYQS